MLYRIIDSGKTLATQGIHLLQLPAEQFGVILYSPVYEKNVPLDTVEQRRQAFQGMVASVFSVDGIGQGSGPKYAADVHLNLIISDDACFCINPLKPMTMTGLSFSEHEQSLVDKAGGKTVASKLSPIATSFLCQPTDLATVVVVVGRVWS